MWCVTWYVWYVVCYVWCAVWYVMCGECDYVVCGVVCMVCGYVVMWLCGVWCGVWYVWSCACRSQSKISGVFLYGFHLIKIVPLAEMEAHHWIGRLASDLGSVCLHCIAGDSGTCIHSSLSGWGLGFTFGLPCIYSECSYPLSHLLNLDFFFFSFFFNKTPLQLFGIRR